MANEMETFDGGLDSIVIRRKGGRIIGGRSLNVEGYAEKYVKAGHIIIRNKMMKMNTNPCRYREVRIHLFRPTMNMLAFGYALLLQAMREAPFSMTGNQ